MLSKILLIVVSKSMFWDTPFTLSSAAFFAEENKRKVFFLSLSLSLSLAFSITLPLHSGLKIDVGLEVKCGALDHCVEDIMAVVMEELFGETAEKKEVRKIALSMKETGASKSLHTVELLSSVLSFPDGVRTLLTSG